MVKMKRCDFDHDGSEEAQAGDRRDHRGRGHLLAVVPDKQWWERSRKVEDANRYIRILFLREND